MRWTFPQLKLERVSGFFGSSETSLMFVLAVLIGAVTGLASVALRAMINGFHTLFFGTLKDAFSFLGPFDVVPLPIIGGVFVGMLVYFFASEAKGHGVPEVMAAVTLEGGRIRPVVAVVKSLASSICIGSGGSAGREGPIIQIGAGFGSTIGQLLKLSDRRTRSLLASGAAAGIAATFNTPIAGVIFAMEVILLGEFASEIFATVVVSAVVATVVSRSLIGNEVTFLVPAHAMVSSWEILAYVGLGVTSAFVSTVFIKVLHFAEVEFDRLRFPQYLKASLGGIAVGFLGVYVPQIFGVGYETMDIALMGGMTTATLAFFIVAKIIATSFTLGSGGSGGVFAPSLFIGAMVGGLYGRGIHALWPHMTAGSGDYALVGMAGLFAATGRAPITAVVILFEMTQDYAMILPLLFTVAVSATLGQFLSRESIYTSKLMDRGIDLFRRKDMGVLQDVLVSDTMKPVAQLTMIDPDMPLTKLARVFRESFHHGFAIAEANGDFFGLVTLHDLERVMKVTDTSGMTVRDIASTNIVTAFPDETVDDVLRVFGALDVGRIPVVSRENHKQLVGMLRWSDIVRSHSQIMLHLEHESGTVLVQCDIGPDDPVVGKALRDIHLPPNCVVNAIQRDGQIVVPRGDTMISAGDRLDILATAAEEELVSQYLYQVTPSALD